MDTNNPQDFNKFLASMANSNDFNNLMSGLTNTLQQDNNNQDKKQNKKNKNKKDKDDPEDDNDESDADSDDDEFDELLYNLLTNKNEEPFPNILSRIEEKLDNVGKCFEKQNDILEKMCEQFINK